MRDVSGIGRTHTAAIAGVQGTRFADDLTHIVGFAAGSGEARLRALAASGRGSGRPIAAKPVGAPIGTAGRLDFRALSDKTARTVARDSRE